MEDLYQVGDDQIERYADYYLLKPIELCMRLKQVTQQDMLEIEAEYQVSLDVEDFSIYLQKSQYDNIVHLLELFNDYSTY